MEHICVNISCKESLLQCYRNELVPENPQVNDYGVKGLLQYRKNKNIRHPDSALTYSKTKWISEKLYGSIPESQDTIFNCWAILKIYDAVHRKSNYTRDSNSILSDMEKDIEVILPEHLKEFDLLAERQHCIANFMPAPHGFNGWKNKYGYHPGKGEYGKDNDFPDIYYKRAKIQFPQMYKWLNEHMTEYSLELFEQEITPWQNGKANYNNMTKKTTENELYEIVKKMNILLCERAENILKKETLRLFQ